MAPPTLVKPAVGDPVKKQSLIDVIIDWIEWLNSGQKMATTLPEVVGGGFENDTDGDGIPDGWNPVLYSGGLGSIVTTGGIQGTDFFRFTHPGGASPAGGGYLETQDGYMQNISPNKELWLSWAHKCSVAVNLRVKVELYWFDEAKVALLAGSPTVLYNSTSNPTTWLYYAYGATPPATARYVKVRITGGDQDTDPGVAATVDFDDVRFFEPAKTGISVITETPGTYTQRVPSNCIWSKITARGAGGGGGGGASGIWGGGGAAKIEGYFRVHPGRLLTIVVPTGGAGGAASPGLGTSGVAGAAATITDEDGTVLVSATGGGGGFSTKGLGGTVAFGTDLANKRHGRNGSDTPGTGGGNPAMLLVLDIYENGVGGTLPSSKNGVRGGGGSSGGGAAGGNGGDGLVAVLL